MDPSCENIARPRQLSVAGTPRFNTDDSEDELPSLDSAGLCAHTSVHVSRIVDISSDTFTAEIDVRAAWLLGTTDSSLIEKVLDELNATGKGHERKQRLWTPRLSVRNCKQWLHPGEPRVWFSTGGELRPTLSSPVCTLMHMELSGLALLESYIPGGARWLQRQVVGTGDVRRSLSAPALISPPLQCP